MARDDVEKLLLSSSNPLMSKEISEDELRLTHYQLVRPTVYRRSIESEEESEENMIDISDVDD